MVISGGDNPSGYEGAGSGGGGSRQGRGEGRRRYIAVGDKGQELTTWYIKYRFKHIRGTKYITPMASVLGLELHHPTMSTMWVHGDW